MAHKAHYLAKLLFLVVLSALAAGFGWVFGGLHLTVIAGVLAAVAWIVWSAYVTYCMVLNCHGHQRFS